MEPVNLRKLKRPQLIELASHFKIKRRHRLRKRDLIKKLEKLLPQIPEKLSLVLQQPRQTESSTGFAPGAPPPQPEFVDRGAPIPMHYGTDRINVLVRDPNGLHVYWELEGPRRSQIVPERGDHALSRVSWILRLHTDGEGPQDIPVVGEACNWYLSVDANKSYRVEIGVIPHGGEFISLATSDRVHTPPMGLSADTTCDWMRVDDDFSVTRLGAREVSGAFADALAERFAVPGMSSRFLGGSEHVPGSGHMRRRTEDG